MITVPEPGGGQNVGAYIEGLVKLVEEKKEDVLGTFNGTEILISHQRGREAYIQWQARRLFPDFDILMKGMET